MGDDGRTENARLVTLDALRGFAVMGILAMNIVAFAMPEMAYVSPRAYGGDSAADVAAWALSFLLVDGKMRGLFSILFGASLLLIVDRAEKSGQNPASVHYRRMAWLAIFGLCHFFFLWWGDILFLYAAVGCIAFLFRGWEARRLIRWAAGLFTLGVLLMTLLFGGQLFLASSAGDPGAAPSRVTAGEAIRDEYAKIDTEVRDELALYRGGYLPILDHRLDDAAAPFAMVLVNLLETLPLMMIGMALFRNGFLTGAWEPRAYRRTAWRWLPPGLLLTLFLCWLMGNAGFDYLLSLTVFLAWAQPGRLMMTIGYAALLVLLIQRHAAAPWVGRVAAAGRAAFSNYLGTSVVMTTIFYGYGLGQFGAIGRAPLYLFVVGAWALMLLWSKPWLDRFRYGPFEWLWRSLARGAMQPMRKDEAG
ncbi:hypothetical protein CVO77_06820 [Sphingopyxis lindanitolerans]|uniref:DUF418 domain-containing protein n=1 Tax=Sphingopyxis lindanitolerans TaxID=2054227 RepID=A0A2S8B7C1_9SPHN|nr:DUF418 domain-containing protein [Sphingopyxis lindanitolerans]PQM28213.1 hypothetical protein CVO77_06820 [Sphingopyxis lindanitolerans]